MPHPAPRVYTTTGAQLAVILNPLATTFSVTVGVWVTSGTTAEFGVEYTLDDPNDDEQETRWYDDSTLLPGSATSAVTRYETPIYAVRLNITANAGGKGIEFKVLQAPN